MNGGGLSRCPIPALAQRPTLRSTGRPGTRLQLGERLRGPPVSLRR
jgi:hypothetical protein